MATKRGTIPGPATLAPVVLITGSEAYFADRALTQLLEQAHHLDANVERTDVIAATYQEGQLEQWTSPSLFGESRLIVIKELETMTDALQGDLIGYVSQPAQQVWVLLRLNSAQRGKKLVEAVKRAHFPVIVCDPLKRDDDKMAHIVHVVKEQHRDIAGQAARALVDAWGDDLSTLMSSVHQLIEDVPGRITEADVRRYFAGRNEVTGFEVADAALGGNTAVALTQLRYARATGVDPIPIVGAMALKLRQLAKATMWVPGNEQQLGMQRWQLDRARKELRGWSESRLARAIEAVALADEETKGLSKDPDRAVEKAVMEVCRLRGNRR